MNRIVVNVLCNLRSLSFILKNKLSSLFSHSKFNSQLKIRLDSQQILKKPLSCNKKTKKNNLKLIKLNAKEIFDANNIKTNANNEKTSNIEITIKI